MSEGSKANNGVVKEEKNKQAMNRRKLLGSLAVVGGVSAMPSTWVKPVINSVFLPAHAQTSITDASPSPPPAETPTPPGETPVLSLSATSIDVTFEQSLVGPLNAGISFLLDTVQVISSNPALASGGDTLGSSAIIGLASLSFNFIINDSLGTPSVFFPITALLPGQSSIIVPTTDLAGFDLGLEVSLSPDGNTLNLSLI